MEKWNREKSNSGRDTRPAEDKHRERSGTGQRLKALQAVEVKGLERCAVAENSFWVYVPEPPGMGEKS